MHYIRAKQIKRDRVASQSENDRAHKTEQSPRFTAHLKVSRFLLKNSGALVAVSRSLCKQYSQALESDLQCHSTDVERIVARINMQTSDENLQNSYWTASYLPCELVLRGTTSCRLY
jgi:hypothetical protein